MKHVAWRWMTAIALALAGCQGPSAMPVSPANAAATLTIDAVRAVDALGNRPNALWQDALFNTQAVRERRKASPFHVQTVTAAASWTGPAALPAVSTNGVAYAHHDSAFGNQNPLPDERVWVVCDDANGTVVRLNPSANGAVIAPNYQALAGLAGAGVVTKSALMMSGTNARVYLLTSGGFFVMLDAATGARVAAVKLSNAGFAGTAPFIDYSNGGGTPGLFDDEMLYALATDGSLYRVRVQPTGVTVRGWRAVGGADAALGAGLGATAGPVANGGISVSLAYGGAVTIKASPIVWNNDAFFGATNGKLYRVRTAAGALDELRVSSWPIETTPAVDFDASFTSIADVFVPGGDRLHWVDASSPTGLTRKAISPPLVVDKKPASGASGASGVLSAYTFASAPSTVSYPATDWVAAATAALPAGQGPSRWGNNAVDLGAYNTVAAPYDLARDGSDGTIWMTCPSDNKVRQFDPPTGTITATYDGNGNYAALVRTINVGTNPCGLTPDPVNGGVWVSVYGANQIRLIAPNGLSVARTISGIPNPTGLAYDDKKTATSTDDVIWVCSTTGTTAGPIGGDLYRVDVTTGALASFDNANTSPTAKNWNAFGGNPANNTALTSGAWSFKGPQGVAVAADGKVWVANTAENLSRTTQNSGQTPIYPFQLDGTGSAANDNGVQNDRSTLMVFDPATNTFTDRIVCTGAPYGLDAQESGNSMWVGTYRWGQDVVERYDSRRASSYARLYRSTQTSNHWQPRWVAVDDANNRTWVVNGNSSWPAAIATNGLDGVKAGATNTGNNSMAAGNTNFLGTYQTGGQPRGVDTDSVGNVWVANSAAQACTKYSGTGTALGTYPVGAQPYAVACDKFDVAWVANLGAGTVSRLTPTILPPAPLVNPRGLSFDTNGNMWIANRGDDTLTILDTNGNPQFLKIATGSQPQGVVSGGGKTWVCSNAATTVQRFDALLGSLLTSLTPGGNPAWADLTTTGAAYVSVPSQNRLYAYTAAGAAAGTINVGTDPRSVCVNPTTNDVWVANRTGNSASYIVAGGTTVNTTVTGLNLPEGVVAYNNQAWLASTGNSTLTRVNARTGGGRVAVGATMGVISGYAGAGGPIRMMVDPQENLWVANSTQARLSKIWLAGQQDLLAADNYRSGDGIDSYAYLRFPIGLGTFGGRTPSGVKLQMTSTTGSALTTETLKVYAADDTVGGVNWTGFGSTPNVDWDASPAVGGLRATNATAVGAASTITTTLAIDYKLHDAPNSSVDTTNGVMSYAFQSTGGALSDMAHWNTTGAKPQLVVSLQPTKLSGAGLRSQPTIDSINKRIFVMGTNAVFEVRYDTPANFGDASKVAYSYTKQGIGVGPLTGGTNYVTPQGASTLTYGGRLVTLDYDPAGNTTSLNSFQWGSTYAGGFFLDPSGNNTTQLLRTATINGPITNSQITYDYDYGSVYMVTGASVQAVKLLQ